jgi:drug/metabolite transporter (DMT)-like permease
MKKENAAVVVLAFGAIYIIWGTTYVAILFGLQGFLPFTLSALRFAVAGLMLLGWCLLRGEWLPALRDYKVPVVSGIVMLVGGTGLVAWSEQYVTSGQAAIMIAGEPFLFLLLDKKRWPYYFSGKRIIVGLLVGFSGIVLFFVFAAHHVDTHVTPFWRVMGFIVLFLSGVLWAGGSLYAKDKTSRRSSNTMTTAIQLVAAGIFSALLGGIIGEWTHFSIAAVSAKAWGGLLYLIVLGSVVAYLAFTWLLSIRPPAVVSTHTYVNPVVAVVVGWLLAHETITALQIGALFLILTGVMLVNKKPEPSETVVVSKAIAATAQ